MIAPLEGLVVADFTRVLAGPLATSVLADLGATVIKVERPTQGDDTRAWGPPWTGNSSSYFESANRSKKSIALDLADKADARTARRLAERADILVENFKSGALARHGLDYVSVSGSNPGIVYASVTGYGSRFGAQLPGYDVVMQAVGGLMSITGEPDGRPLKVGVALVDVLTAKDAVVGILSALRVRDLTGRGQLVEVNLLSSLLGSLVNQASSYLATGIAPGRLGNRHPSITPFESLQCKDGYIVVCCGNEGQFARFAEAIGAPELIMDPRFATNGVRVENRDALVGILEVKLSADVVDSWVDRVSVAGVPCGKVGDIGDGISLAESMGLDPLVSVGEDVPKQVRNAITFSETPVSTYFAPPRLGEHSDEVRAWLDEVGGASR